jgi:glutamyl-tRNA reductase
MVPAAACSGCSDTMSAVMAVLCLGVSFRRAPLELLERMAFAEDELTKAYQRAADDEAIGGCVILSTCNRVEAYAEVPAYHAGFLALKRLLAESREIDPEELAEPLSSHYERDAADHLFAVAAGLDSMVLGETQIASQVRDALRRADAEAAAVPELTALFHAASRAGRRVRAETSLGAAPDAIVSLGADLAEEALGDLQDRSVAIVGAGQMASLAAKHLRRRGVGDVAVLNRSIDHARTLAGRVQGAALDLSALPRALADADLVVSATGAAGTVIRADAIRDARAGSPLVLLDLAVPRDVESAAADLPGVRLIDIVALRGQIDERDEATAADIARAHEIVAEEVLRWVARRRADELAPLLKALRSRGDDVMQAEVQRYASRLADLTPDERDAVRSLARGIVAKLLHDPIATLKERSEGPLGPHAKLMAELLGLDPE